MAAVEGTLLFYYFKLMPRHARIEAPGFYAHITARGIDGISLFRDDSDRDAFIGYFQEIIKARGFKCIAWTLMDNHYHLLMRSGGRRLADLMNPLNGRYARYYNTRHGRRGYLFQNRFFSTVCQNTGYARELIRYIHLNPLRAGLVSSLGRLSGYRWCTHRVYLGKRDCPWVHYHEALRRFGRTISEARTSYIEFLNAALEESPESTTDADVLSASVVFSGRLPAVIGDPEFVRSSMAAWSKRRAVYAERHHAGWSMVHIAQAAADFFNIPIEDMHRRGRGNARSEARSLAAYIAREEAGITLAAIARFYDIHTPPVLAMVRKGAVLMRNYEIDAERMMEKVIK